jgi:hypothetical protein
VLELAESGLGDQAIADRTGVPRPTVRTYRRRPPRRALDTPENACPTCGAEHDLDALDPTTYAYLLGAYLGDGWLGGAAPHHQLRIACDLRHPGIINEIAEAIETIVGRPPHLMRPRQNVNCIHVAAGWKQWACHLPQHGRGRKHLRTIELADRQTRLVDRAPEAFLRGLIHSDGCRTVNHFDMKLPSGRVATYEYPRYFFSNLSPDILALFTETCDLLGIRWTQSNHRNISISHRHSVARMDGFVGPKA